jgi:hypothetical protein
MKLGVMRMAKLNIMVKLIMGEGNENKKKLTPQKYQRDG